MTRLAACRPLQGEDPDRLAKILHAHHQSLQPEDSVEEDAVEAMVRAQYQLARIAGFEARLLAWSEQNGERPPFTLSQSDYGRHGLDQLGRWLEREERSLDRAHRRLIRQRTALRKGLFEPAPTSAPPPPPAGEDSPTVPTPTVSTPPPPKVGEAGWGPENVANEPNEPPEKSTNEPNEPPERSANEPEVTAKKIANEPNKTPKPPPAKADPADPAAFYAELIQHPKRESLDKRLEGLPFHQVEALMRFIQGLGYLDAQPVQAFWAWKTLQRNW